MRHLSPVLWTKGVLLSPQHLQAQDRQHDDALAFQTGAAHVLPWGVSRLEIDREALAGGTLVVSAAAGRLPDGLLFDAPAADPSPPPKAVADAFAQDQDALLVYLAVPEYRPGGRNVAPPSAPTQTRWRTDEQLRRDETTGLAEKPLQVARANLRLLVEGDVTDGYTTLPVARVLRAPSGTLSLDHAFVPPLLEVSASEFLSGLARRISELVTARSAALAGGRRERNVGLADFTVADIGTFWLQYTLNSHAGVLRHLHEVRGGHPEVLWSAMLALASALTTFAPDGSIRTLPAYDHLQLGPRFAELEKRLVALIQSAIPESAVSLPLKPVRQSLHAVAIEDADWLRAPQWVLAVRGDLPPGDLAGKVLQACKVGSADVVETLIRQALPGLELTHLPQPPAAVPVKLDMQYFAVRRGGSAWEAIERARNLAVYVPQELGEARFELVVVLK